MKLRTEREKFSISCRMRIDEDIIDGCPSEKSLSMSNSGGYLEVYLKHSGGRRFLTFNNFSTFHKIFVKKIKKVCGIVTTYELSSWKSLSYIFAYSFTMGNKKMSNFLCMRKVWKIMKIGRKTIILCHSLQGIYPTFALKQITFSLFDIVAITQLLIRLSCRFRFFHLIRFFLVRCHFRVRIVLLIRQTMTIALLNAFTWLRTRTPFTPTAPSWVWIRTKCEVKMYFQELRQDMGEANGML